MSAVDSRELAAMLTRGADDRIFSGAVLHVRRGHEVLTEIATGRTARDAGDAVTPATFFDLASVTKVFATTSIAMRLCERGALSLDDPLGRFLANAPADKTDLTLRRLLSHTSGLPAWRPYVDPLRELALAGDFAEARRRLIDAALQEAPEAAPGARHLYSDVGFVLLGAALEACAGARLDALFLDEVVAPLGLREAFYVDLASRESIAFARDGRSFACTENCPWRGFSCNGVVHDDNCYAAGGILGHAGLFATARSVGAFGAALLDVHAGRSSWLAKSTLDQFAAVDPDEVGGGHALGFDVSQPPGSQAGSRLAGALGHLGFTGTSLWVQRERALAIVLLTNRVHPSREDARIRAFRPALHDLLLQTLEDG